MTSARKRRILNKRIRPSRWVLSYLYCLPGQDWQAHVQRITSRAPPKTFRIDLPVGTLVRNTQLKETP